MSEKLRNCLIFSDIKMLIFGLSFLLFVLQLSGRNGFKYQLNWRKSLRNILSCITECYRQLASDWSEALATQFCKTKRNSSVPVVRIFLKNEITLITYKEHKNTEDLRETLYSIVKGASHTLARRSRI